MIFKQLFEPDSSTYSYLLACERSGESVLIDPVIGPLLGALAVIDRQTPIISQARANSAS